MRVTMMTYNILTGGVGPGAIDRTDLLVRAIESVGPDVVALQEANGFLRSEEARLDRFTRSLGMTGIVGEAGSGFHVAVLARPELCLELESSNRIAFRHACVRARIGPPGRPRIGLVAAHLNPFTERDRLAEVEHLLGSLSEETATLVVGDLNGLSPLDSLAPEDVEKLLGQYRTRDGTVEHRALSRLLEWGLVDLGHTVEGADLGPTYPTPSALTAEGPPIRIDYVLATPALVGPGRLATPISHRVVRDELTDQASDHHPVVHELEIHAW